MMMYHSRHFLKQVVANTNGVRQVAAAAQRVTLVPAANMSFFVMNKNSQDNGKVFAMNQFQMRQFSGSLPAH